MKVYQLRILELGYSLEQVFKDEKVALYYKNKYKGRNIIIKEYKLNIKDDFIYRIKNISNDGYTLEDNIYETYNQALSHIKNSNQIIIKERLCV